MSDFDMRIDCLRLHASNVAGHEHRLAPIAEQAASIFVAWLDQGSFRTVRKNPRSLNLQTMSDGEAAEAVAEGWLLATILKASI